MTILDKIIRRKEEEVRRAKQQDPEETLRAKPFFDRTCIDFCASIKDPARTGIIAEFKRASPSKGIINDQISVQEVTKAYSAAGVSAVSVLTDQDFFRGSTDDLMIARSTIDLPILRKDFIIDPYQVIESKSYGSDVILLIAAVLTTLEIKELSALAKGLGMYVLVEVHNRQELEKCIYDSVDAIGVNNRNLHDFSVSLERSRELGQLIPSQFLKISESGISKPETIKELKTMGFHGFLIGENFMKSSNPGKAIEAFSAELG